MTFGYLTDAKVSFHPGRGLGRAWGDKVVLGEYRLSLS